MPSAGLCAVFFFRSDFSMFANFAFRTGSSLLDGRLVFWCWRVLANAARRGRVYNQFPVHSFIPVPEGFSGLHFRARRLVVS
jgi:hypothetical protein